MKNRSNKTLCNFALSSLVLGLTSGCIRSGFVEYSPSSQDFHDAGPNEGFHDAGPGEDFHDAGPGDREAAHDVIQVGDAQVRDAVHFTDLGQLQDVGGVVDAMSEDVALADVAIDVDAGLPGVWPAVILHDKSVDVQGLHHDSQGRVYVTGKFANSWTSGIGFHGALSMGGEQWSVIGSYGTYLARFDATGQYNWGRVFEASTILHPFHLQGDAQGNLYLVGIFSGTTTIEDQVYASPNSSQSPIFWTVDSDGHMTEINFFNPGGQNAQFQGNALASGYQSLAGLYGGQVDFGSVLLPAVSADNAFFAMVNPDRTVRWAKTFACHSVSYGYGTAMMSSGVSFIAGQFNGACDFGLGELVPPGGNFDIFVASYDLDGTPRWQIGFGAGGYDQPGTMAVDANGISFVAGAITGSANVGSLVLGNNGANDGFVAAFSPAGSPTWVHNFGGPSSDGISDLVLADNRVFVAGFYTDDLIENSASVAHSAGGRDGFVAILSMDGAVQQVFSVGGPGNEEISKLSVDVDAQKIWIAGTFTQPFTLDAVTITPQANASAFVGWLPLP